MANVRRGNCDRAAGAGACRDSCAARIMAMAFNLFFDWKWRKHSVLLSS